MQDNNNSVHILWTSGDKELALNMVLMYAYNAMANGWWDTVHLIVWGPSQKLIVEDPEIYARIHDLKGIGVKVDACKGCSDIYGISGDLERAGCEVIYVGKLLTELLKAGKKVLTF